jgi:hypothetical protein
MAGRNAEIDARNPYCGQGIFARMWRLGYQTRLVEMLMTSPAAGAPRRLWGLHMALAVSGGGEYLPTYVRRVLAVS